MKPPLLFDFIFWRIFSVLLRRSGWLVIQANGWHSNTQRPQERSHEHVSCALDASKLIGTMCSSHGLIDATGMPSTKFKDSFSLQTTNRRHRAWLGVCSLKQIVMPTFLVCSRMCSLVKRAKRFWALRSSLVGTVNRLASVFSADPNKILCFWFVGAFYSSKLLSRETMIVCNSRSICSAPRYGTMSFGQKFSSAQRSAYLLISVPHTGKVLDDTCAHKNDQRAERNC